MFVAAIELAAEFTRPIHTIYRYFGSPEVHPSAATLFFVNSDGWALTCRHVAEQIVVAEQLATRYRDFSIARGAAVGKMTRQLVKDMERAHGFGKGQLVELKNLFVNCAEGQLDMNLKVHPTLDVALIRFVNFRARNCTTFPIFGQNGADLRPGRTLCRLGFPFPEFTNFAYDAAADRIDWIEQGQLATPRFPLDGMVTRHLLGPERALVGFETSTPGLRGQSGGPVFDTAGRVWGMQAATAHLDLNFDVDMEVVREGGKRRVKDSAILHVGHCIHVEVLKDFMREQGVAFAEG